MGRGIGQARDIKTAKKVAFMRNIIFGKKKRRKEKNEIRATAMFGIETLAKSADRFCEKK